MGVVTLIVGVASLVTATCTVAVVGAVSRCLIAIFSILAELPVAAAAAAVVLMVRGAVMEGGGAALATAGVVIARGENGAIFNEGLAEIGGGEILALGADTFGDGVLMSTASSLALLGGGGGCTSLCFRSGC